MGLEEGYHGTIPMASWIPFLKPPPLSMTLEMLNVVKELGEKHTNSPRKSFHPHKPIRTSSPSKHTNQAPGDPGLAARGGEVDLETGKALAKSPTWLQRGVCGSRDCGREERGGGHQGGTASEVTRSSCTVLAGRGRIEES